MSFLSLCGDNHDEICFQGRLCPLCEAMGKITDLEGDKEELEKQIKQLEKEN